MKFLRPKVAAAKVGYHPVHMMRKARDVEDDFPAPVRLGPNSVAFVEEEIEVWMERRVADRSSEPAAA